MDWKGKRVVILGAGRQGTALARYLVQHGAEVALADTRPESELKMAFEHLEGLAVEWHYGEHKKGLLKGADLLCLSGGVPTQLPIVAEARKKGIPVSNDSQLFLEAAPCQVVGITGSAGKTTTVMLVARMLRGMEGENIRKLWLGGNIGNPLIANLDDMQADDLCVMELSSFQLELMTRAPRVAGLLNLAPNHLDRHGTMAEYAAAKAHILDHQSEDDIAILGREDFGAWSLSSRARGPVWSFGRAELADGQFGSFVRGREVWLQDEAGERMLLSVGDIELRGEHNLLNVLAAAAIASAAGASPEAVQAGVEGFAGPPHRLEWVRKLHDVDFYDDSIATAPQRAVAALRSFKRPIVLLAGGRDKDLPWQELVREAAGRAVHVVLFGEAGPMLKPLFEQGAPGTPTTLCTDLESAVRVAAGLAPKNSVVLLSPGGTSFDEFVDFEARGERFKEVVNEL
jgi:UDP-N-acetylmuramoylalanine--D-glutamate ligase